MPRPRRRSETHRSGRHGTTHARRNAGGRNAPGVAGRSARDADRRQGAADPSPPSPSPCSTRWSSVRSCRCRKSSAPRRGRRGVRRKNLRAEASAVAAPRTASARRDRRRTTRTVMSLSPSSDGDAAARLFVGRTRGSSSPRRARRRRPRSRGNGPTREATSFSAVASVSATTFSGARREAGLRIAATHRATATGSRAAVAANGACPATVGRRGARAGLFSFSQRAVDVRARTITKAVATTNPVTIRVSVNTAGHPRCGRGCSGSRSSEAASGRSRQNGGAARGSAPAASTVMEPSPIGLASRCSRR